MDGTFAPLTFKDFSGGFVSKFDRESDSLASNESPDLLNVNFDGQGSFEPRLGDQLVGTRNDAQVSVSRLWTFNRPIRIDEMLLWQRDTTLYYLHSTLNTFQVVPISGSITALAKIGFANYTSSTDTVDFVYFCDGVSLVLQRWNGAHTQLNGALAGGEATITVDSTTGFNATGSIDVGGTTVTYTGKTATTFTGCGGTPAAADNIAIEQIADAFSASSGSKPLGNILEITNSQLAVANGQFVKLSDVDDFTDWGSGLATSKGFKGGRITSLKSKDKKLIVQTTNTIQAIEYEQASDLATFLLNVEEIEDTSNFGTKVFTGIHSADGEIFYMGNDNTIRRIVRSPVSALFDTGSISNNIKNLLKRYTTSNCESIFFEGKSYFATQSPDSQINDTVWVFDHKYGRLNPTGEAWLRWGKYVSSFAVFNNYLYYASTASANVFRMFKDSDGDEILLDDGAAIPFYYTTPVLDGGQPELKWRVKKAISRGFISPNTEVAYTLLYDYGITGVQEESFLGSNELYVLTPALDVIGEEVIGEDAEQDEFEGLYPFTYPMEFGTFDCYNFQFKVSGETASQKYKQTRIILYIEPQDDVMTA
jgi:hypothetical protein